MIGYNQRWAFLLARVSTNQEASAACHEHLAMNLTAFILRLIDEEILRLSSLFFIAYVKVVLFNKNFYVTPSF